MRSTPQLNSRLTILLRQNLLGLFLRPLRVFISSESLRRARIVLLKTTHAPAIAAISAYEYVESRRRRQPSVLNSGPESSPVASRRPIAKAPANSTGGRGRGTTAARPSSGAGEARSPQRRSQGHRSTAAPEQDGDLRLLVMKLSSQVEKLTGQLAEQQRWREELQRDQQESSGPVEVG